MTDSAHGEFAVMRRPIDGVEALHARFIRHRYPRHSHESATVALMETGVAGFAYRGESYVVGPGDVFLLNPGEVHTGEPVGPDGYLYRVLYLDGAALSPLLTGDWGALRPALAFRQTVLRERGLGVRLRRLHAAIATQAPPLLTEELLLRLGQTLLRRYGGCWTVDAGNSRGTRGVRAAREYLEAHPTDKVPLRDLAAAAETSPYRLVRMFSAEMGMPPHAYHTQLRVRLARRLLAAGVPAVQVAAQTGFYDQAHLTRVFKNYTGVSPARFSQGARMPSGPGSSGQR